MNIPRSPALLALAALAATPALSNMLVPPGPRTGIANSRLSATPASEWNRLSHTDGKFTEVWTIDGDQLDKVTFFGGVARGKALLREVDRKHHPLPTVKASMLITDIPVLLETTYRIRGARQMTIDTQEPAMLGGHKAIRFTYHFTLDDEVRRKGEGLGALVDGKLYLVTYEAPALHFFDKDVARYRALAASITL
ncbi:hypothetical protein HL653_18930 [Sphingomonas sp. AP4-R1]|uniref:hypothetical protein n=1 Tax=Sphingomonas sp. AP4-R1 TaxID=2735134 RepID=UPI0014938FED|nr:hypothetical protein [Sphingomonas sp. AP4-R1]QJU59553.1 hypothetical protein HL653_18930 [Sphingomonas sp. AP4-R1]